MNNQLALATYYEGRTILVTGAGGYIGSHFVDVLSQINCHVFRFSRKKLVSVDRCVAHVEDVVGDLADFNDWDNLLSDVDFIFHFAAQTGVSNADNNPTDDAKINVLGSLRILEAAKKYGDKVFVFSGAATMCGLQTNTRVSEKVIDRPITLYDVNKIVVENYLKYFCHKGWVQGVSLRLANVYGSPAQSSNKSRGVLNLVMQNALSGKDAMTFCGGNFVRDYIYIDDVIAAFLLAGKSIHLLNGDHYVIGTGVGVTLKKTFNMVIEQVNEKTNSSLKVQNRDLSGGLSPIDQRDFIADSTAFSEKTNWYPSYSLEMGIAQTILEYQTAVA